MPLHPILSCNGLEFSHASALDGDELLFRSSLDLVLFFLIHLAPFPRYLFDESSILPYSLRRSHPGSVICEISARQGQLDISDDSPD